jgi:hypothetical protein
VLDDFQRWTNGEALRYAVAPGTLAGRA